MRKLSGAVLLLLFLTGCGTFIEVQKETYNEEGQMMSKTKASYSSTKDVQAPSLSIDKDDVGYNLEMKAEDANNSEPMKQVVEGMKVTLDGLNKLRP